MYRNGKWKHVEPDYGKMSDTEIIKFFEREQKRFDNGFQGLDGGYYMYLTQFQIRHRATGATTYPDDMEVYREIVFPYLAEVERLNADSMWITQRGAGKSTVMSGYLPLKTAIKFKGSKTIMTAESLDTTRTNFHEKLKVAWENMHPMFRPSLIDGQFPNEKSDKQYVKFGVRGRKNSSDKGLLSIIESKETAQSPKSPTKLEGQGAKSVIVDEIFKHPYVDEIRSKADPLVKHFSRKVGSIYYVGSLSDATAKGLANAVDMWKSAKTYGIMPLFVDATWFNTEIQEYDNDGNMILGKFVDVTRKDGSIDRVKAREQFLKIRRALEKLPSKKALMDFILMFPLEVNELLDVMSDSWWGDDELMMFKEQKKIVQQAYVKKDSTQYDSPAFLYKGVNSKPELSYDIKEDHAKFFIFERPKVGATYGVGVDTIPNNSEKTEGSSHAAVVKCFDTNQYVGLYYERSTDITHLAKKTLMLQEYYNDALALVERNSIGAFKLAYEHEGKTRMLAKNPKRFRPRGVKLIELGLHKGNNTPELRQLLRSYVANNMYTIFIRQFFEEFLMFPFENTDMMDAMAMAEALHEDYKRLERKDILEERMGIGTKIRFKTGADGKRKAEFIGGGLGAGGMLDIQALMRKK